MERNTEAIWYLWQVIYYHINIAVCAISRLIEVIFCSIFAIIAVSDWNQTKGSWLGCMHRDHWPSALQDAHVISFNSQIKWIADSHYKDPLSTGSCEIKRRLFVNVALILLWMSYKIKVKLSWLSIWAHCDMPWRILLIHSGASVK